MTEQAYKIERARTKIFVPAEEPKIVVAHPFYGPANSKTLQEQMRKDGLEGATSGQLTTLAGALFGQEGDTEQEFTGIMRERRLRAFTGILYDPAEKVAHFIDNPEFSENSVVDKDNLIQRIRESHAQVSFEHLRKKPVAWNEVAKHPYFIAWAHGEEGAENLAKLAKKHSAEEAYIWVPNLSNLKQSEARVMSLYSDWGGDRLSVSGDVPGNDERSHAFGMFPASETSAPKTK